MLKIDAIIVSVSVTLNTWTKWKILYRNHKLQHPDIAHYDNMQFLRVFSSNQSLYYPTLKYPIMYIHLFWLEYYMSML